MIAMVVDSPRCLGYAERVGKYNLFPGLLPFPWVISGTFLGM